MRSSLTDATDTGEVEITVTAVNDAPVITGAVIAAGTDEDPGLMLDLLSVAAEIDNRGVLGVVDPRSLPDGFALTGATLTADLDGLAFRPLNAGEVRLFPIPYSVVDSFGAISPGGLGEVSVTGGNDAPSRANAPGMPSRTIRALRRST